MDGLHRVQTNFLPAAATNIASNLASPLLLLLLSLALNPGEPLGPLASQAPSKLHASVAVDAGQPAELACHLYGAALDPRDGQTGGSGAAAHANETGVGQEQSSKLAVSPSLADQMTHVHQNIVSLIFWYKDDNPVPMYTLDARHASIMASEIDKRPASLIGPTALAGNWKNERLLSSARHHVAPSMASSRLSFDTKSAFPILKLRIERTQASDSGRYRCRIDFKRSPTINQQIGLLVRVAADGLELSASSSKLPSSLETTLIQANEDELLELVCSVRQGSPPPKLSWLISSGEAGSGLSSLRAHESAEFERAEHKSAAVAISRLVLGPLNRMQHFNVRVGCLGHQAEAGEWFRKLERNASEHARALALALDGSRESWPSSRLDQGDDGQSAGKAGKMIDDFLTSSIGRQDNELESGNSEKPAVTRTLSKWIRLKLNLKPSRLDMEGSQTNKALAELNSSLSAELVEHERAELVCRSVGSSPAAKITWAWPGQKQPLPVLDSGLGAPLGEPEVLTSWSKVELSSPSWREHLSELVCTATNEAMPADRADRAVSTRLRLSVKFKPVIRLSQIGFDQDGSSLAETRLRCQVRSNPPINQLVWLVNEQPLAKIMVMAVIDASSNSMDRAASELKEASQPSLGADHWDNNELLNQSNWRQVSQELDKQLYKLGPAWNELLVVANSSIPAAQYQCLAISDFGQTISSKVSLDLPYLAQCQSSPDPRNKLNVSLTEISQLLGFQVHLVSWLDQSIPDSLFACPVQADPEPSEVSWSFVPLDELGRNPAAQIEQLNPSAGHKVTAGSVGLSSHEITLISGRSLAESRGLLMCRARNKLGWQQKACINLLLHVPEQTERPSAENCTLGARVERANERVVVEVDCSHTLAKERLIFQLAISRQDGQSSSFMHNSDNALTPPAKRFLFTDSPPHGRLHFSINDIQANLSSRNQLEKRGATSSQYDGEQPIKLSLRQQVDLLRSLVFVLRASDLISTSEARAIYGADLRLELSDSDQTSQSQAHPSPSLVQVSRSSGQGETGSESLQQVSAAKQRLLAVSRAPGANMLNLEARAKLNSPYDFEVGITIVAIFAVTVLSCLTFTLIVILLSRRGRQNSACMIRSGKQAKDKADSGGQDNKFAQVQLMRLDLGPRARPLDPLQAVSTCDMLALPASSQAGSSSGSSRRTSLNLGHYDSSIYKQPARNHPRAMDDLPSTSKSYPTKQTEPNETFYLIDASAIGIEQNEACKTHSPATATSPESQAFITLADCELHKQASAGIAANFCSSSNHNSLSFCDEFSLTATLTTSDLAVITEVSPSGQSLRTGLDDDSVVAYDGSASICNKVYLLDPF